MKIKKFMTAGIDQSVSGTGLVIMDDDFKVLGYYLIKSKEKDIKRLIDIARQCLAFLKIYSPDYIFIEQTVSYRYGNVTITLSKLAAMIEYYLYREGYEFMRTPPTCHKKLLTGKGNFKKELVCKKLLQRWEYDTDDNNIADAYCMARMGVYLIDINKCQFGYEKKYIELCKKQKWFEFIKK